MLHNVQGSDVAEMVPEARWKKKRKKNIKAVEELNLVVMIL